jgi:hypothetical protein
MKVNVFKKLIKEAVAEAVREELVTLFEQQSYQKQPISEVKNINFTSNDIGSGNIKDQLRDKMGAMFGYGPAPQQTSKLEVIDQVDATTGEPVNPYLNFIMDAANNMSAHDKAGLRNLDT